MSVDILKINQTSENLIYVLLYKKKISVNENSNAPFIFDFLNLKIEDNRKNLNK